jgi:nitrogen PTS system EIIA component
MQLTVRNVSELLSVSEKTVYRWITERRLPGYRVSGQYRFNRAELLEWATGNKVQVSARILHENESELGPMPDLGEALQAGGIHYRLTGGDKGEVLRNVVEMLRLPEGVDRAFLWDVLMAREALESTGVGDGIAIPHARSPIVLHVTRPMVTLCFLEKPVEFGALDGKPVHALFSLISPTVKGHLHLLSRLAFALRDATLKAAIERQAGRDDIVAEFRRVEQRWHHGQGEARMGGKEG